MQGNGTGRSARVPVALLAVAVLAVLVLAVLVLAGVAARSGSYAPELRSAPTRSAAPTLAPAPPPESAPRSSAVPTPSSPPDPVNPVTGRTVLVLVLLLAAAGLVLLALAVRHRPRLQRRPPDAVVPPAGEPAASALTDAMDRALAAVEQPDAREAVVQAWLRLGAAAAEAGTPSRPAETATEYAERLARAHGLPPSSVHRLAALYREARFSGHPVHDDQRDEARAHLTALRAALTTAPAGWRP